MVAELRGVELLPDASAQSRDDGLELVVAVNLVGADLLHVQHLAPEGKDGLEAGVPALGGRAACGVALDDIDLGELRVILVAVPELVRHGRAAESALAPDGLPGLLGGLPGPGGHKGLVQDHPPHLGVLLQEGLQLIGDQVVDESSDLAVAELGLGLALKLGVRQLHGDNAGETLPAVLAGDLLLVLEHLDFAAVGVEHRGEGPLEALLMHAALGGVDVVGEGEDGLVVAVMVLKGDFRHAVVLGSGHVDDLGVDGILAAVEVGDELPDAAGVAHGLLHRLLPPAVRDADLEPGVEEGLLPHAGAEDLVVIDRVLEHLRVRLEGDLRAVTLRDADDGHLLGDLASGKLHLVDLPVLEDLHLQPLAEGVDNRRAHAVEAAGDLVAPAAELSAGMENGIDHLQGGPSRLGLDVHGDAAAVVRHGDSVPGVDGDVDLRAVARQRLVNGVVHDLINQVMEARGGRGTDIHARALADGFQSFQHLDLGGVILVGGVHRRGIAEFCFSHGGSPFIGEMGL